MTPMAISRGPAASNKENKSVYIYAMRMARGRYTNSRDGYYFFRIRNKFLRAARGPARVALNRAET